MVSRRCPRPSAAAGFPRASGDGPHYRNSHRRRRQFPPRERGWSRTRLRSEMTTYVSPARAGMVLGGQWSSSHQDCFPRASGDGPHSRRRLIDVIEFPPRERGWSPTWVPCRLPCSGFPRASGDGPSPNLTGTPTAPFPPRERGWSRASSARKWSSTVSPARAGMVPRRPRRSLAAFGFPRASGAGPDADVCSMSPVLFPPRERGWSHSADAPDSAGTVSPARAGMVPIAPVLMAA